MAKMDKAEIAKQLFSLVLGMGIGGSTPGGISMSFVPSVITKKIPATASTFAAKQYPTEFAPDPFHIYDVVNIPGKANENSLGKQFKPVIAEAGRMQTIDEHNKAITKYVRPGMDPKQLRAALNLGLEEEKRLPQFWNESNSRRPFKVSSSAVSGIRLTPDARIEVRWRSKKGTDSKWYTFKQYPDTQRASLAAQELLNADSIGRAVYPVVSRGITNPKNKELGEWNFRNYDGSYA